MNRIYITGTAFAGILMISLVVLPGLAEAADTADLAKADQNPVAETVRP